MTRLRRPDLPPHLEEKFWRGMPKGTKVTPTQDLQLDNMPLDESACECVCHSYPDYEAMLAYWNEVPE